MQITSLDDSNGKSTPDPWDYQHSPDDDNRKAILLSELPRKNYQNVLSIGCGRGFVTKDLPGEKITGIDISAEAIASAKSELSNENSSKQITFLHGSIFDLPEIIDRKTFDLIVITGVIYPSTIGQSLNLIYLLIDNLLSTNGILASVHIAERYCARFPYLCLKSINYNYREHNHLLEIYAK